MSFINKLQERWQVKSGWQVLVILVVFACTGYSIVIIKHLLGIRTGSDDTTRVLFYIAAFPIYNLLLLAYGYLFGQFKFFLHFERRFFSRIAGLFKKKHETK